MYSLKESRRLYDNVFSVYEGDIRKVRSIGTNLIRLTGDKNRTKVWSALGNIERGYITLADRGVKTMSRTQRNALASNAINLLRRTGVISPLVGRTANAFVAGVGKNALQLRNQGEEQILKELVKLVL